MVLEIQVRKLKICTYVSSKFKSSKIRNGLTEKEMEEVLSLDNDVLNDVYQFWAPPSETEIRIPPMIWARLKHDIEDFVVSKQRDSMTVMSLYHKQFMESIRSRYLLVCDDDNSSKVSNKIYKVLFEFFSGQYAGQPKEIRMALFDHQPRMLYRNVRVQPLEISKNILNFRVLSELPNCLMGGREMDLYRSRLLTNFEWLTFSTLAGGFDGTLQLFDRWLAAEQNSPSFMAISRIREAVRLAKAGQPRFASGANFSDELTAYLAGEMTGRLVGCAGADIEALLSDCRRWCREQSLAPIFLAEHRCFSPPDSMFVTKLSWGSDFEANGAYSICLCDDNKHVVCVDVKATLRIWELKNDSLLHTLQLDGTFLLDYGTQVHIALPCQILPFGKEEPKVALFYLSVDFDSVATCILSVDTGVISGDCNVETSKRGNVGKFMFSSMLSTTLIILATRRTVYLHNVNKLTEQLEKTADESVSTPLSTTTVAFLRNLNWHTVVGLSNCSLLLFDNVSLKRRTIEPDLPNSYPAAENIVPLDGAFERDSMILLLVWMKEKKSSRGKVELLTIDSATQQSGRLNSTSSFGKRPKFTDVLGGAVVIADQDTLRLWKVYDSKRGTIRFNTGNFRGVKLFQRQDTASAIFLICITGQDLVVIDSKTVEQVFTICLLSSAPQSEIILDMSSNLLAVTDTGCQQIIILNLLNEPHQPRKRLKYGIDLPQNSMQHDFYLEERQTSVAEQRLVESKGSVVAVLTFSETGNEVCRTEFDSTPVTVGEILQVRFLASNCLLVCRETAIAIFCSWTATSWQKTGEIKLESNAYCTAWHPKPENHKSSLNGFLALQLHNGSVAIYTFSSERDSEPEFVLYRNYCSVVPIGDPLCDMHFTDNGGLLIIIGQKAARCIDNNSCSTKAELVLTWWEEESAVTCSACRDERLAIAFENGTTQLWKWDGKTRGNLVLETDLNGQQQASSKCPPVVTMAFFKRDKFDFLLAGYNVGLDYFVVFDLTDQNGCVLAKVALHASAVRIKTFDGRFVGVDTGSAVVCRFRFTETEEQLQPEATDELKENGNALLTSKNVSPPHEPPRKELVKSKVCSLV